MVNRLCTHFRALAGGSIEDREEVSLVPSSNQKGHHSNVLLIDQMRCSPLTCVRKARKVRAADSRWQARPRGESREPLSAGRKASITITRVT